MQVKMNSKRHENARVVSILYSIGLEGADSVKMLSGAVRDAMKGISSWANDSGVIIGHIKGYLSWDSDAVAFSTVGGDVETQEPLLWPETPVSVEVGVTEILFGCDKRQAEIQLEQLAEITLSLFEQPADFVSNHTHEHEHVCGDDCDHGG